MTKIVYEVSPTTHWKNLHPKKSMLLGSHNLNENEELVAEIEGVSVEKITSRKGKEEHVPMLHFKNAVPNMVLNVTNSRIIAEMYGDETTGWAGKLIQIYKKEVNDFGGGKTMGLRIRNTPPSEPKKPGKKETKHPLRKKLETELANIVDEEFCRKISNWFDENPGQDRFDKAILRIKEKVKEQ